MPRGAVPHVMPVPLARRPPCFAIPRHELTARAAYLADFAPHAGLDAASVGDRVTAEPEYVVAAQLLRLGVEIGLRLCLRGEERQSERRDDAEPGFHGESSLRGLERPSVARKPMQGARKSSSDGKRKDLRF